MKKRNKTREGIARLRLVHEEHDRFHEIAHADEVSADGHVEGQDVACTWQDRIERRAKKGSECGEAREQRPPRGGENTIPHVTGRRQRNGSLCRFHSQHCTLPCLPPPSPNTAATDAHSPLRLSPPHAPWCEHSMTSSRVSSSRGGHLYSTSLLFTPARSFALKAFML